MVPNDKFHFSRGKLKRNEAKDLVRPLERNTALNALHTLRPRVCVCVCVCVCVPASTLRTVAHVTLDHVHVKYLSELHQGTVAGVVCKSTCVLDVALFTTITRVEDHVEFCEGWIK